MEFVVRPLAALALLGACIVAALVATHSLSVGLLAVILLVLLLQASPGAVPAFTCSASSCRRLGSS